MLAFGIGAAGRLFPAFFKHIGSLLGASGQSKFRGCHLEVPSSHDRVTTMVLGAHCQCGPRLQEWRQEWEALREGMPPPHRGGYTQAVWARHNRGVAPWQGELVDVAPRVTYHPKAVRPPPHRSTAGMFRGEHAAVRCQIDHRQLLVDSACVEAAGEARGFLHSLHAEAAAIFSSVGVNESMADLLSCTAVCWRWDKLVFDSPGVVEVPTCHRSASGAERGGRACADTLSNGFSLTHNSQGTLAQTKTTKKQKTREFSRGHEKKKKPSPGLDSPSGNP